MEMSPGKGEGTRRRVLETLSYLYLVLSRACRRSICFTPRLFLSTRVSTDAALPGWSSCRPSSTAESPSAMACFGFGIVSSDSVVGVA